MTVRQARSSRKGFYVALEGIDGAGKSTLRTALGRSLRRRGLAVRLRREPVDPAIGRLAQEAGAQDPWTGAVYFTVDRHLAVARLRADLRAYDLVLSDRSFYSTLAYQGSRLPPADRVRLEELQRRATIQPDLVVLLDLPPTWLRRRWTGRGARRAPLERVGLLEGVARAYRQLAQRGDWVVLDARQGPSVLVREATRAILERSGHAARPGRGKPLRPSRPRRRG